LFEGKFCLSKSHIIISHNLLNKKIKMKSIIKITAILIIALSANSCKKSNTQTLPPATTIGANTFGCKVDGVVCSTNKYRNDGIMADGIGVHYTAWFSDSCMIFTATTENPKYSFHFAFKYDGQNGTYFSEGNNRYMCEFNDYNNGSTASTNGNTYNTDENNKAKINVAKFNETTKTISGTFQMDVVNKSGKVIHITEGRFDIQQQ
jgi:hypothetical protein